MRVVFVWLASNSYLGSVPIGADPVVEWSFVLLCSLLTPLLVLTQFVYPAGLMVLGVSGNDYYLRDRFEKIEEKWEKTMTNEEGQSIEKDLVEVKSTTEGLKTDMNKLLKTQDELTNSCVG